MNTRTGKVPSQLDWADIDADTISAFLNRRHHMKEKDALTTPATVEPGRYRPPDKVFAFFESL